MKRHPAGAPSGGQFAPTARTEPALDLPTVALDAAAARDLHATKLDRALHLLDRTWQHPRSVAHDTGLATAEADIALRVAMPQITADADTTDLALELARMRRAQPGFTAPTSPLTDTQVAALARYSLDRAVTAQTSAQTLFDEYHTRAVADPSAPDGDDIPEAFDHARGTRDSYAQSYAELVLGAAQHPQAAPAAERLITALTRGVVNGDELQEHTWDPMYPPIPGVDD